MSADPGEVVTEHSRPGGGEGGGCLELLFPPVLGPGSCCFALTGGCSKREVERVTEA